MKVKNAISSSEIDMCLNENKLVVLYFTASWCGPCKSFSPQFEKQIGNISDKWEEKYAFYKINVDNFEELCKKHNISSVPTVLFLKEDKITDKLVGCNLTSFCTMLKKQVPEYNCIV